eukprot:COSAG02_NODE_36662_length_452_cov_0.719547_1_plen_39_part_10
MSRESVDSVKNLEFYVASASRSSAICDVVDPHSYKFVFL